MGSRFLVTTAQEETWPFDEVPVLFLGEWCRCEDRKSVWGNRNAIVAPYHWDDRKKIHKDYIYLQTLYEELLGEIVLKLNALHGVDHSVRYWRIILGPWLGWFTQILFDRWSMLRQEISKGQISGVRVLRRADYFFVPNDMADFSRMLLSDPWNEAIYGQLMAWMDIPVNLVDANNEPWLPLNNAIQQCCVQKDKLNLAQIFKLLSCKFCKDSEYFFISSYMPRKQDVLLQLMLGQVPKFWQQIPTPITSVNRPIRGWEVQEPANAEDFPGILRAMLPKHIPTAYVEGYQGLLSVIDNLPWPKRPKLIFTSVSFSSDDVFKVWAAEKIEKGTPFVTGQHGGVYGMARWSFAEDHQLAISDRFLSWGRCQHEHKNIIPVGNLKCFGGKASLDKGGVALLVQVELPRTSYHMYSAPVAGQWLDYFEDQCCFVSALPDCIRNQLVVRLYRHDRGWNPKERWKERFPSLRLDGGGGAMDSLVRRSRVYISTYNATTYLESMSLNIPTIIFWNPKHWELRDSAIPYFEKLKSVGIFHETPKSAAQQIALIWNDVSGWWESDMVQSVRQEFCEQYAYIPERPLGVLSKLFRAISDAH